MRMSIKCLILGYQEDRKEYYEVILRWFDDKVLYWERRLNNPDANSDLNYFLFNLIRDIDVTRFDTDDDLFFYIKSCIENKGRKLEKANKGLMEREFCCDEEVFLLNKADEKWNNGFSDVECRCLLEDLKEKEKCILYKRYFLQYTDAELAEELCISRQAVNKARKKALEKISKDDFVVIM